MVQTAIEINHASELHKLLTVREACQILNVHPNTLRRWCKAGFLKEYRIGAGDHRRFKQGDLAALLVKQRS